MDGPINVFVIGDLILDHVIPVSPTPPNESFKHPDRSDEPNLRVRFGLPRRNFAGGAALAARQSAAISNNGRTCLWGLTGRSQWGSFHDLLETSQQFDGADNPIINYASHNEARRLNTSIVIMEVPSGYGRVRDGHRQYNILDLTTHQVTEAEARSAFDHLKTEQDSKLDVVIFSDLNLHAISADLVRVVGGYLFREGVPVIVDLRSSWSLYQYIPVTFCILLFDQWLDIVKESAHNDPKRIAIENWIPNAKDSVRQREEKLLKIGILSHRHMPSVSNLLIHCFDRRNHKYQGTVVVIVSSETTCRQDERNKDSTQPRDGRWDDLLLDSLDLDSVEKIQAREISVYHLILPQPAHPIEQLGAMRVLSSAVAIEFVKLGRDKQDAPMSIVCAVRNAGRILSHYLDPAVSAWHRVPVDIPARQGSDADLKPEEIFAAAVIAGGDLLLPAGDQTINLRQISFEGSDIVSDDPDYKDELVKVIENMGTPAGWNSVNNAKYRSCVVLTGKGGGGKTEIVKIVKKYCADLGIEVWDNLEPVGRFPCESCTDANAVKNYLTDRWNHVGDAANGLLLILDEAFKVEVGGPFLRGLNGVKFVEDLADFPKPTRALLVDADFTDLLNAGKIDGPQFKSRCEIVDLPPITSRLRDIPYIFAMCCFSSAFETTVPENRANKKLQIEEECLVRVVNWVLGNEEPGEDHKTGQATRGGRELVQHARAIGEKLRKEKGGQNTMTVRVSDLPRILQRARPASARSNRTFAFIWTSP